MQFNSTLWASHSPTYAIAILLELRALAVRLQNYSETNRGSDA